MDQEGDEVSRCVNRQKRLRLKTIQPFGPIKLAWSIERFSLECRKVFGFALSSPFYATRLA